MNRGIFLIVLLLVSGVFIIYFVSYRNDDGKASIWTGYESEFSEPIEIVWQGKITSTMAGGSCIGLKGEFDGYSQALACLQNIDSNGLLKLKGTVTVVGKWLGISCAYKNTVFGECVPDVSIEKINSDPIYR